MMTKHFQSNLVKQILAIAVILVSTNTLSKPEPETIKVGILHSLSGTMAISESVLKDTVLMLISEQNKKGGLLGKQLEPVFIDPKSNWPLFAEKTRQLIEQHQVDVIFGCWTSASRKSVQPIIEDLDSLLFYPVQYEGQESSEHIFYTGASPNQQAIPAVDYLIKQRNIERWVLMGTDYVYPRTTNEILIAYLRSKGVSKQDILINYTPFGFNQWQGRIRDVKIFSSQGKNTAIISTINGDANISFYQELVEQKISANQLPVLAFSIGEQELALMDAENLAGHLTAWNYFMSLPHSSNQAFIKHWRKFIKNEHAVTNDPMEAHFIGFNMWLAAVNKTGSTEPSLVKKAIIGSKVANLSGGYAEMLANHHITKPVMVGEIQKNGSIEVVWRSANQIAGDAWSDYLTESKDFVADWSPAIMCGKFNHRLKQCFSQ